LGEDREKKHVTGINKEGRFHGNDPQSLENGRLAGKISLIHAAKTEKFN